MKPSDQGEGISASPWSDLPKHTSDQATWLPKAFCGSQLRPKEIGLQALTESQIPAAFWNPNPSSSGSPGPVVQRASLAPSGHTPHPVSAAPRLLSGIPSQPSPSFRVQLHGPPSPVKPSISTAGRPMSPSLLPGRHPHAIQPIRTTDIC